MYIFKHFYIFEETDFIFHFLYQENMNTSLKSIKDFDKENPKYVSFRRKIIADNVLNPKDREWEMNLPKEQLQKLNDERIKANITPNVVDAFAYQPYDDYQAGDYIWHNSNKGEIVKVYNFNNHQKAYDIKVGKEFFTKVNCKNLQKRTNIRKQLEIVPDNTELKTMSTKNLLSKFKSMRRAYFGIGIDSRYLKDNEYFFFLQIRKELCKRPHVTKKEARYNKK